MRIRTNLHIGWSTSPALHQRAKYTLLIWSNVSEWDRLQFPIVRGCVLTSVCVTSRCLDHSAGISELKKADETVSIRGSWYPVSTTCEKARLEDWALQVNFFTYSKFWREAAIWLSVQHNSARWEQHLLYEYQSWPFDLRIGFCPIWSRFLPCDCM